MDWCAPRRSLATCDRLTAHRAATVLQALQLLLRSPLPRRPHWRRLHCRNATAVQRADWGLCCATWTRHTRRPSGVASARSTTAEHAMPLCMHARKRKVTCARRYRIRLAQLLHHRQPLPPHRHRCVRLHSWDHCAKSLADHRAHSHRSPLLRRELSRRCPRARLPHLRSQNSSHCHSSSSHNSHNTHRWCALAQCKWVLLRTAVLQVD